MASGSLGGTKKPLYLSFGPGYRRLMLVSLGAPSSLGAMRASSLSLSRGFLGVSHRSYSVMVNRPGFCAFKDIIDAIIASLRNERARCVFNISSGRQP
jgi:hypothetical protein